MFNYANVGVAPSTGNASIAIYIKIYLWFSMPLRTDNDLYAKSSMSLHIGFSSLEEHVLFS